MAADREALCAGHLAGTLDEAERAELARLLAADPGLRSELARQVAVDRWLRASRAPGIDAGQVMRALPVAGGIPTRVLRRTRRLRPASPWRRLVPLAAAALLLVGLGVLWSQRTRSDDLRLADGQRLAAGSHVALADGGTATLLAGDGSRLVLHGRSDLEVDQAGGEGGLRLTLREGNLSAEVGHREAGRPLVVVTPHASATVVGTRFTLAVDAAGSHLAVAEGVVEFADASGVQRIGAGEEAVLPHPLRLEAVADGTLDAARPQGGLGELPLLEVRSAAPERLACLRFDLPPGRIAAASLVLTRLRGHGAVGVYRMLGAWDEALLRYFHLPQRGERIGTLAEGASRLDVTAACVEGRCDLMLVGEPGAELDFASREARSGAPILLLTPAPP